MQTNNLTFESDKFKYKSRTILSTPQVPGMTKFLMNKGIVKNERQAIILMFAITIIFSGLSIYMAKKTFSDTYISKPLNSEQLLNLPAVQVNQ